MNWAATDYDHSTVLRLDERQQIPVDRVRLGSTHAVGKAGIDLERRVLHQPGSELPRNRERNNLVGIAMHHQSGYVDLLQVFGEVRLGKGSYAVVKALYPGLQSLKNKVFANAFGDLRARAVVAVERHGEFLEILGAVGHRSLADAIEYFGWNAIGPRGTLHHDGRNRADQYSLGDPLRSMTSDIPRDFST